MRSLIFYSIFIVAAISSAVISMAFAKDTLRFIETTGRAVIENNETIDTSRRRALEDALYLAALHGGAKINGFSTVNTDTSIQENLVVQPASQILDYTIISEKRTDTHFTVKIQSAVGELKNKGCKNKGLKSLSIYKPIINVHTARPATGRYRAQLLGSFISPLSALSSVTCSGSFFQNTSAQILIIEYSVSKPTRSAIPATRYSLASRLARTTMNLAKKPDSGGMPASDRAGIRNSNAR